MPNVISETQQSGESSAVSLGISQLCETFAKAGQTVVIAPSTPSHILESNRRSYAKRRKARPGYEARRKSKWLKSLGASKRRKISREQSARISANLTDGYVRGILTRELNLLSTQITPEQIAAKRASLKAKRARKLVKSIS